MSHRFGDEPEEQQLTHPITTEDLVTIQRFAVHVVEGEDAGRHAVSDGEELSIGSAQGNALMLADRAASRHHCTITVTERGFLLRDLGSTNGTKLGGYRVGTAYLKSGATFKLGRSTLRFDALDEQITSALSKADQFGMVLGRSAVMRRVLALLPKIAASGSTVLLEGETGTGKTLLASAIHDASTRSRGPFVVVDCAAMTPTLIESQLFGHARGAYTGASNAREGAFVAANNGTIFLDEVGELPVELQPKLLRVLEERVITPLGETRSIPIDVRVIAATNRDLRQEVNSGHFRADLFYRLHVLRVTVPPLRERPEDIEQLARHFWEQISDAPLPRDLLDAWRRLHWSGNVRELRAAVERAVLLGDPPLEVAGSPAPSDAGAPFRVAKDDAVRRFEKDYLTSLHRQHAGNISRAARAARMDRNHLRELFRKYHLVDDA